MALVDLIDNSRTDKNTTHSYLDLYETLLSPKKTTAKKVLEIGIDRGGSIKLWSDYFDNATIYGFDIIHINNVWSELKHQTNIVLCTSTDAYGDGFFDTLLKKKLKFDVMIDDGPHTLESMKHFIIKYSQLLAEDGILIIEDVAEWEWIDILKGVVPDHLTPYIETYDLRPNKNRYDDIVFVINRNKIIE